MTPHLKPLYKETTFWVLLFISLPGTVAAYWAVYTGLQNGAFNEESFLTSMFASPIVLYLGVGRQYARGKAVEASVDYYHPITTTTGKVDE